MATVTDILSRKGTDVVSLVADESVLNAAHLMNERGIGGVVVTISGEMVGIFTERDILRRVVAERRDPATTLLRAVMTTPVTSCRPDDKLADVTSLLTKRRVRHLPVVDDSGLCGIITSGDILALQVEEQQETLQHLNNYVQDMR